jgi:hypothetical protein
MEPQIKRRIAIGAAGATILAGGGGAYALADRGGDAERQAFIGDAANRLHVSSGELRSALRGAFFDRLDADVKKGRLSQKEADQIKQRVRQRGDAGPPGPGGGDHPGGPGHPGGPFMEGVQAAAKYLGVSEPQLHSELRAGKSLAQVAKDKGKSVDGLKAAIKDAVVSRLDGRIGQMVNHSGPPGPPGRGARRFGAGPPPGPPPPGF